VSADASQTLAADSECDAATKPAETVQCSATHACHCFNGEKDGDEEDVDCGGSCGTCSCGLPSELDPEGAYCTTFTVKSGESRFKTFGSLDVDDVFKQAGYKDSEHRVTLTISAKTDADDVPFTLDENGFTHPETRKPSNGDAALTHEPWNGRYVLPCAQTNFADGTLRTERKAANGKVHTGPQDTLGPNDYPEFKTIKLTVRRPTDWKAWTGTYNGVADVEREYPYFQGEFLNMYKKDEWTPLRTEKEPYMHNAYGTIIPLPKFRSEEDRVTSHSGGLIGQNTLSVHENFNVFMAAPKTGDFIFRYGNPNLVLGADGTDCAKTQELQDTGGIPDGCGTWTALEFGKTVLRVGTPWTSCGSARTDAQEQELKTNTIGAIFPAYLGNPNLAEDNYTAFINAVTATSVPTDVILEIFSPRTGATDKDGNVLANNQKWTFSKSDDGALEHASLIDGAPSVPAEEAYTQCYPAGQACPKNYRACKEEFCNVNRWGAIQDKLRQDSKNAAGDSLVSTLGFIETRELDTKDTDSAGNPLSNPAKSVPRKKADILADVKAYQAFKGTQVDGYYFNRVDTSDFVATNDILSVAAEAKNQGNKRIVFGTGIALANPQVVKECGGPCTDQPHAGAPDLVVTVTADMANKRNWHPYAWFPTKLPSQWGAMLTDVPGGADGKVTTMVNLMFDRGYGYVGMHPFPSGDEGENAYFQFDAAHITETLNAVEAGWSQITNRRLQATDAPDEFQWSCDATLFHCGPVCMRTTGTTTMIVSDSQCEGVAPDGCGCQCLFDAAWTCEGDEVVCTAQDTVTMERRRVGDMVCSTRGSEAPARASFSEAVYGECAPQYVSAGDYPSAQCMAVYEERYAQREARQATTEAPKGVEGVFVDTAVDDFTMDASVALPAALCFLAAFYA